MSSTQAAPRKREAFTRRINAWFSRQSHCWPISSVDDRGSPALAPPHLALIQLTEAAVAVPFRMPLPVFFPHQLPREMTMLLQLLVQSGEVGKGSFAGSFDGALVSEQCLFDARLVPAFRQRPAPLLS